MKGLFLSVEGGDGAGKTTQIKKISDYFIEQGFEVVLTREPGGTKLGELIRELLLHNTEVCPMPKTELFLLAAARAQHLEEKIIPCLEEGKVVITDRFADSMVAYQGFGRNLGMEFVEQINDAATGGIYPDLTIYLDIPIEEAFGRVKTRADGFDRMEQEEASFHNRTYEGYQALCRKYPERISKIMATAEPEAVFEQIKVKLKNLIAQKGGK